MLLLKVLLLTAVILLAVAFSYFNTQEVSVAFFNYSVSFPLFGVVIGSVIAGGIIPTLVYTFKISHLRRRILKTEEALRNLWLGFNAKSEPVFKKLSNKDEVYFPLFLMSGRNAPTKVYTPNYNLGIAETYVAEGLLRVERERAVELLERALGKNWKNLRAKKRLRDLYALLGELEKAVDLQREILKESYKGDRKLEERILSSLESIYLLGIESFDREPRYKVSAEYYFFKIFALLEKEEGKRATKLFEEALDKGFGNKVVDLLMNAKRMEPAFIEIVEKRGSEVSKELLCRLYIKLGMFERATQLKSEVSKTLSAMVELSRRHDTDSRKLFNLLKELYTPWKCYSCGKAHTSYKFVCDNCLEWFNINLK